jgi:HEAT repeat protein
MKNSIIRLLFWSIAPCSVLVCAMWFTCKASVDERVNDRIKGILAFGSKSQKMDFLTGEFRRLKESKDQIPSLEAGLFDEDEEVRVLVCGAILARDGASRKASERLAEMVASKNGWVRVQIASALKRMVLGSVWKQTAVGLLNDVSPTVRTEVLRSASVSEKGSTSIRKELFDLLDREKDDVVRAFCIRAIGKTTNVPDEIVVKMRRYLKSPHEIVRQESVMAFAKLGSSNAAVGAIPELLTILKSDSSQEVRQQAALSLGQLSGKSPEQSPDIVRQFVNSLKHEKNKFTKACVIDAIATMNDRSPTLIPVLLELIDDSYFRNQVVTTLGLFGSDARDALPVLRKISRTAMESNDAGLLGLLEVSIARIEKKAK